MARFAMQTLIGYSRLAALLAGCFLTFLPSAASAQVLFEDDFDDNAAGWVEESLTGNFGLSGSDVVFGYDYSADGIPEAPNSAPGDAATSGVRLRTNTNGLPTDQNSIAIENVDFSGQYTVQVDMWLNWPPAPGAVGTTLHGGLYVGDALAGDLNTNTPTQRGAGFIASSDGDCGNCDYILLKNEFELDTFSGQYSVTEFNVTGGGNQPGYDETDVNTDPANGIDIDLPAFLPTFDIVDATGGAQTGGEDEFFQPAGAAGFQWITVTAEVDPTATGNGPGTGVDGTTKFSITNVLGNTLEIGTIDNSRPDILDDDNDGDECDTGEGSEDICVNLNNPLDGDVPVDMEGRISLVLIDFFAGAGSNIDLSYALFDNIVVTGDETGGLMADFNGDGSVDLLDLDILGANFGNPGDPMTGDANGDGTVDLLDLDILGSEFGMSESASAVPEPTTALLAGLTLGLLPRRRRR